MIIKKILIMAILTIAMYGTNIISEQKILNKKMMSKKTMISIILESASDMKTSTGVTFERAICAMAWIESNNATNLIGDMYFRKYFITYKGKRVYIPASEVYTKKGVRYAVYKGRTHSVRFFHDKTRPKYITDVKFGIFHMGLDETKIAIARNAKLYNRYNKIINNDSAIIILLLTDVKFNAMVVASGLIYNYEIALKRKMYRPYTKAISRHNGGWYNKRYTKKVAKLRRKIFRYRR